MANVSIRMSKEEKELLESYAKLHNESVSVVLKESFFEKVEDELDFEMIKAYEKEKASQTFTTFEKVVEELGVNEKL